MSCNCGCSYNNLPCCCPTIVQNPCSTTTTICPDAQPCSMVIESECIIYNGQNFTCAGITTGMTVAQVVEIIINSLSLNCTTTTSSSSTTTTTTVTPSTTTTTIEPTTTTTTVVPTTTTSSTTTTTTLEPTTTTSTSSTTTSSTTTTTAAPTTTTSSTTTTTTVAPTTTTSSTTSTTSTTTAEPTTTSTTTTITPTTTTTTTTVVGCNCFTITNDETGSGEDPYEFSYKDCVAGLVITVPLDFGESASFCAEVGSPIITNFEDTIIDNGVCGEECPPVELQANAGSDMVVSRFAPYTVLDSSLSTGPITGRTWTLLNPASNDENGHVMMPNAVETPIFGLQYRSNTVLSGYGPGEYIYQLQVTDGVNTSTDTCKVTVTFTDLPPQRDSSGGWRYLTIDDYMTVPNGAVGDYYIDGANDGFVIGGQKTEIYLPASLNVTLGPGKKLLIKAGKYERILLNFADGLVEGTALNPVIFTNSGGQIETMRGYSVKNARYAKITGKYVPGISGDINFQGHANGNYAFRRGKYGIYNNNCWCNLSAPGIEVSGKDSSFTSVEYCEAANGGFAGIYILSNAVDAVNYDGVDVYDNYIHDTGGEGIYIGTTGSPFQQLLNFKFHNNTIARAANEGLQVGQLAGGADVYNNVVFMSATRWVSPFNDTQVFGAQIGVRNGDNKFRNNVVIGAGEQLASVIIQPLVSGITNSDLPIDINNNAFIGGIGFIGNYIGEIAGVTPRPMNFNDNLTGQFNFLQDRIYIAPYSHAVNTQQAIRTQLTNVNLTITNLVRDDSKNITLSGSGAVSGTTVVASLPDFTFNAGFDKNYYTNYSLWAPFIYDSYGDEFQVSTVIRIGQPYTYNLGDMVMWQGKFYTSNINGNTGNMPSGATDANWTKLTWTDGITSFDYPPDDFREYSTDYYRNRNIGLVDTLDI